MLNRYQDLALKGNYASTAKDRGPNFLFPPNLIILQPSCSASPISHVRLFQGLSRGLDLSFEILRIIFLL